MDTQEIQEKFEDLLLANPDFDESLLGKDEEGCYSDSDIQHMYSMFEAGTEVGEQWQAAKAQAVPKWISVEDKLPPANILVLGMSQTPRNIFNIYNVMALDEFEEADVTHWMPLPDAPQESVNEL